MLQEHDEDDVTVFDRTNLLSRGSGKAKPNSEKCSKMFNTFALCGAFFGVGLALAIPGPTLQYLRCHIGGASIQTVSYIFPARSLGYLVGSILGGFLFDRFASKGKLLVGVSLILGGITICIAPWTVTLAALCICLSIASVVMGFLDTGGNVICLKIWGKDSGPYMQSLHFAFGVGACLAPLVAAPFLNTPSCNTTELGANVTTTLATAMPLVLEKRQNLVIDNTTTPESITALLTNTSTLANINNITTVHSSLTFSTTSTFKTSQITDLATSTQTALHGKPSKTGASPHISGKLDDSNGNNIHKDIEANSKIDFPPPETTTTISQPSLLVNDTTGSTNVTGNDEPLLNTTVNQSITTPVSTVASSHTTNSLVVDIDHDSTTRNSSTTPPSADSEHTSTIDVTGSTQSTSNSTSFSSKSNDGMTTPAQTTPAIRDSSEKQAETTTKLTLTSHYLTATSPTLTEATPYLTQATTNSTETTTTLTDTTSRLTETTSTSTGTTTSSIATTLTDTTSTEATPTKTALPTINITPSSIKTTPTPIKTTPTSIKTIPTSIKTTPTPTKTTPTLTKTTPPSIKASTLKPTNPAHPAIPGHKPGQTFANDSVTDEPSILQRAEDLISSISTVQYSYLAISLVMITFGILFFCLHSGRCSGEPDRRMTRKKSENDLQEVADIFMSSTASRSYKTKVMSAVFVFFFLYVGTEVAYGQFIATFGIHHKTKLDEQQAALLTSIYWGAFAIARGLCIPLSKCLTPNIMLIISISIAVCSSVGLAISTTVFATSVGPLWFFSSSLGAGMAAIFPTGVLWLEGYIKVTSKMAAIFVCASALGEMVVPAVVGLFIQRTGPLTLIFTTLICMISCAFNFGIMKYLVSSPHASYRQLNRSGHREDGSLMQMQEFEFSDDSDVTDSEPILTKRNGIKRNGHQ